MRGTAERLLAIASWCEETVAGMDFGFLYDRRRMLFAIGWRESTARSNLLLRPAGSEARLTSFLAIAKGDVPPSTGSRWDAPSPPSSTARPRLWSGSAFEYLMPSLVMKSPRGASSPRPTG
jgi:cyclic beta-1,2-glucan synthetase